MGQDTKGKEHGEVSAAVRDEEKFGNAESPGALKKIHALVPRCLFCGSLAPTSQAKISWCGLCRDLPVTLSSVQRKYSQESIQDNKSRLKGFLKGACKG